MAIIDKNVTIDRFKRGSEIHENVTIVTAIEFPPILSYDKFRGKVYTLTPKDQILAVKIQDYLERSANQSPVPTY